MVQTPTTVLLTVGALDAVGSPGFAEAPEERRVCHTSLLNLKLMIILIASPKNKFLTIFEKINKYNYTLE